MVNCYLFFLQIDKIQILVQSGRRILVSAGNGGSNAWGNWDFLLGQQAENDRWTSEKCSTGCSVNCKEYRDPGHIGVARCRMSKSDINSTQIKRNIGITNFDGEGKKTKIPNRYILNTFIFV